MLCVRRELSSARSLILNLKIFTFQKYIETRDLATKAKVLRYRHRHALRERGGTSVGEVAHFMGVGWHIYLWVV